MEDAYTIPTQVTQHKRKHRSKNDPFYAWELYRLLRQVLMKLYQPQKEIVFRHRNNRHTDRKTDHSLVYKDVRPIDIMRLAYARANYLFSTYHVSNSLFSLRKAYLQSKEELQIDIAFDTIYQILRHFDDEKVMKKYQESLHPPLDFEVLAEGLSFQLNIALTHYQLLDDLALLRAYSQFKKKTTA